jgi:hypothetical protein
MKTLNLYHYYVLLYIKLKRKARENAKKVDDDIQFVQVYKKLTVNSGKIDIEAKFS